MIASWVLHGEGLPHWFINSLLGTVVGFLLASAILTPAAKWIKDQLDPHTPGGLGDLLNEDGIPTHVALARHEQGEP